MKNLFLLLIFLPLLTFAQNDERKLLTLREFKIKHGNTSQFMEGVKMWMSCYNENGGNRTWNMWKRVNGDGIVFIMAGTIDNWAEFDKPSPVGTSCRHIIQDFVDPYVESMSYNISYTIPNKSRKTLLEGRKMVHVTSFKTNNDTEFNLVLDEIHASLRKAEGDVRGFWHRIYGGGPGNADYFVSVPYVNYAGLDVMSESVWTVYEKEHGKTKTEALRARWRACVTESWSYLYSLEESMSRKK